MVVIAPEHYPVQCQSGQVPYHVTRLSVHIIVPARPLSERPDIYITDFQDNAFATNMVDDAQGLRAPFHVIQLCVVFSSDILFYDPMNLI